MPPLAEKLDAVSVADYLTGEQVSEVKHEYLHGQVYAMAGAKVNHNRITRNLSALLWNDWPTNPASLSVVTCC